MLSVSTQLAIEDDLAIFAKMLKSVSFVDEIIVFNMGRKDKEFIDLCHSYHARIIEVITPKVVEEIRARQVRVAKGDWVLIMDYDEIIPPNLAKEIISTCSSQSTTYSAYSIPRKNFSLGYPLSHGGFGTDYVHRLFRRSSFSNWPKEIHSTPIYQGQSSRLQHCMEHHKDASLSQMITKTNRYTDVESRQFLASNYPPITQFVILRKTIMEFVRRYFFKLGFLDGVIGLIQATYQSYSIFLRYAKIYELQTHK